MSEPQRFKRSTTLQATALMHEAYLRLEAQEPDCFLASTSQGNAAREISNTGEPAGRGGSPPLATARLHAPWTAGGKFNWDILDSIIKKWTAKGLKIAFRTSCKETRTDCPEQQYATPRWVMEAGAKGDYYRNGKKVRSDGPWEPVFDDSVFLEKLEHSLAAFARRYDGKPWVRYIDVGSIADCGEGQSHLSGRTAYAYEAKKAHRSAWTRPKTRAFPALVTFEGRETFTS